MTTTTTVNKSKQRQQRRAATTTIFDSICVFEGQREVVAAVAAAVSDSTVTLSALEATEKAA